MHVEPPDFVEFVYPRCQSDGDTEAPIKDVGVVECCLDLASIIRTPSSIAAGKARATTSEETSPQSSTEVLLTAPQMIFEPVC